MTDNEIFATLTTILHQVLEDDTVVLTRQMTAQDVPGFDSFRQIEVLLEVERRFNGRIKSQEVDRLRTLGDYVAAIGRMTAR